MNNKLFSLSVERHALGALVRYPNKYADVCSYIKEDSFFHMVHKVIFRVIAAALENKEPLNSILISNRIKSLGIQSFEDGLDIEEYVKTVFNSKSNEDSYSEFFKELTLYKVRRDITNVSKDIANYITSNDNLSLKEILKNVDAIYTNGINKSIKIGDDYKEIAQGLPAFIEDLGANPPDPNRFLFGPFPSITNILGSLHRPGNITCIGARSGVSKTSLSLYYNLHVALKYNLPILWHDFGEMSMEELQLRLAACLTNGVVPLSAIETGNWIKNPVYKEAIREGMKTIKTMKIYYEDISSMSPTEIISWTRRFKFNKIGRDNNFIWVFDYLKPFDSTNDNTPEWKAMGAFIQQIKTFIKEELRTSFWTCLQLNRSGITNGRTVGQLDQSENSFGMSDRILQQSSHSILVRRKVTGELQAEQSRYGNLIMRWVKTRHLGQDIGRALNPVELPNGVFQENHINLSFRNFFYQDLGDLNDQVHAQTNLIDIQGDVGQGGSDDLL